MFVRAYLRASTKEQDARRARDGLRGFAKERGLKIAAYYIENESGASLKRPELFRLLEDSHPGDVLLIEQVDRLSRLGAEDWMRLRTELQSRQLRVVALDLPTSWMMAKSRRRVHRAHVRGIKRHDARHARRDCPQGLRRPPTASDARNCQGKNRRQVPRPA